MTVLRSKCYPGWSGWGWVWSQGSFRRRQEVGEAGDRVMTDAEIWRWRKILQSETRKEEKSTSTRDSEESVALPILSFSSQNHFEPEELWDNKFMLS
jgi:hypothetical protein